MTSLRFSALVFTAMMTLPQLGPPACAPVVNVPDKTESGFAGGASGPIRVASPPHGIGAAALDGWNTAAGRQLFAISDVQPQITFEDWRAAKGRSIIAPDGTRRSAWVERATDSTGATSHCTVWYDPAYFDTTGLDAWVLAHEIGHCLGFVSAPADTYDASYRGVMSYYGFYSDVGRSTWFGPHDQRMLREAGLGVR